ncbi:MAG: RimK family alpha-L-glutamate ligase [Methanotrichaceae archaeon]|nr:RimK family alpha-L-glutamate ligase [Methanotrichaceae archaeon]
MRFGIVVSDPDDWTAASLGSALRRRGAKTFYLNFSRLSACLDRKFSLASNGVNLLELDGLIVRDLGRRGAHDVAFRFEALQALEELGMPVFNSSSAIARAANKFATSLALTRSGIPTPHTTIATDPEEALQALDNYGRAVSKPLFGYKGRDIELLTSSDRQRLEEIMQRQGLVYLQEFVSSPQPRDIRAFVVGERLMGAIYRVAPPGQWISNLARGGTAAPCEVTPELVDLSVRAARAIRASYCGVDLLETSQGLKVIEVNGTPSGRGLFVAMGLDVTDAIAGLVLES